MRRLYDNPEERIAAAESTIAQQAQRTAELEAELVDRDKRLDVAKSLVREQVQTAAENFRLTEDRDALRAALEWACKRRAATHRVALWLYCDALAVAGVGHEIDHDGTGEGVAAALIRAHRESEGKS